jgi:holliday junction resolvase YEN1
VSLPNDFPNLEVLRKYANPLITGTERVASVALRDTANLDLAQVARLCEEFFEWGYQAMILQRFRNFMWNGAVTHVLRRAALEIDEKEQKQTNLGLNYGIPQSLDGTVGTPASIVQKYLGINNRVNRIAGAFENQGPRQGQTRIPDRYPLIMQVVGSRQHTSTNGILEYRVEISPVQLVEITKSGILGKRAEPPRTEANNTPKKFADPNSPLRLWIPATMLSRVHPVLLEQFLDGQGKKTMQ